MVIDFSKAEEGEFYPFHAQVALNSEVLRGRVARFSGEAVLDGKYVKADGTFSIKFRLTVPIVFGCDRCGEDTPYELNTTVMRTYYKNPPSEEFEAYSNDNIDIMPAVEESVLLSIPSQVYCKEDCKGLCPKCGANLNKGTCNCVITPHIDERFAVLLDLNNSTGGSKNGGSKE